MRYAECSDRDVYVYCIAFLGFFFRYSGINHEGIGGYCAA